MNSQMQPISTKQTKAMTQTIPSSVAGKRSFLDNELQALEQLHPDGLSLAQVLGIFSERGLHLSEATFRKYVQLGLLGRSKRVGRKGKHQGSMGLYPATTIRRIHTIRQMMAASYTIEDIQRSFLRFTNELENLELGLSNLFDGFERELLAGHFEKETRKDLLKELSSIQKTTRTMFRKIEQLERQIISPLERAANERAFASGTSMGAEDLL